MYQETYVEQIVNKTVTRQEVTTKNILLCLMIFFGMTTIFAVHFLCPILFIVFGILYYRQQCKINTEYEYLFVEGTLDIDRVRFQSKRKKIASIDMPEILTVAPEGSQKALAYDHGQMTVMRCGSGNPEAIPYIMIVRLKDKNRQVKIFWEPNEKLLEAMKNSIPDRVSLE